MTRDNDPEDLIEIKREDLVDADPCEGALQLFTDLKRESGRIAGRSEFRRMLDEAA